ncbi:ribonuclease [Kitasatospora sp. NPDC059571]|uniref:ribonuclease n=1 Tax=Kitasatospora sp. NPDC059571 TaxID=3346871 RepID=UPI0036BDB86B
MTSRNSSVSVAVLLVFAIVAAAVYALNDHGHSASGSAAAPSGTAATTGRSPTGDPASASVRTLPTLGAPATGSGWVPSNPALADVCRSRLPEQARDTLVLIARGGPYPYRSDGVVFENREGRLPRRAGGYYHEYTVTTPGSADRGTRRIVTGGAGEEFWTADHYGSFHEIDARC